MTILVGLLLFMLLLLPRRRIPIHKDGLIFDKAFYLRHFIKMLACHIMSLMLQELCTIGQNHVIYRLTNMHFAQPCRRHPIGLTILNHAVSNCSHVSSKFLLFSSVANEYVPLSQHGCKWRENARKVAILSLILVAFNTGLTQ